MLRGTIKSSVTVKAQDVRGRAGLRSFLTSTEDLNYAQFYLLNGFM